VEYNTNKDNTKAQELEKQLDQQQHHHQQETMVQKEPVNPPANRRKQSNPTWRGNGDRGDSGVIEIE
jgi:hypothetical protein